jgi:hypothetical protein
MLGGPFACLLPRSPHGERRLIGGPTQGVPCGRTPAFEKESSPNGTIRRAMALIPPPDMATYIER